MRKQQLAMFVSLLLVLVVAAAAQTTSQLDRVNVVRDADTIRVEMNSQGTLKHSMKIDFNHWNKEQKFAGVCKLNLHNNIDNPPILGRTNEGPDKKANPDKTEKDIINNISTRHLTAPSAVPTRALARSE